MSDDYVAIRIRPGADVMTCASEAVSHQMVGSVSVIDCDTWRTWPWEKLDDPPGGILAEFKAKGDQFILAKDGDFFLVDAEGATILPNERDED